MLKTPLSKYGYLWVTLVFFLFSFTGHWYFAWQAYVSDQEEHNQTPEVSDYLNNVIRDTMENWQSEFLQLMWQVAGLSFLFYVGSPQSKEGDERKEKKIDLILQKIDPENAEKEIKKLENKYPQK